MNLLDEIKSKCSAELLATRDCTAISSQVNIGRVKPSESTIGIGIILSTIGLHDGNSLLDIINTNPDFRYVKTLVNEGRLIVSDPLTTSSIQMMADVGVILQESANKLLALAYIPNPISEYDVRCSLFSTDGTFLG